MNRVIRPSTSSSIVSSRVHAVSAILCGMGTVKSASADSLVVAGKEKGKDAEWTFAIDAKTAIRKSGKAVTAADVKPGDQVQVRYMFPRERVLEFVEGSQRAMAHGSSDMPALSGIA